MPEPAASRIVLAINITNQFSPDTKMTMPNERTKSVIKTAIFLKSLLKNPEIPEEIRLEAKYLLRHYPSADDIKAIGRLEEFLLKPSGDEKREILISLHMPLFSSKI